MFNLTVFRVILLNAVILFFTSHNALLALESAKTGDIILTSLLKNSYTEKKIKDDNAMTLTYEDDVIVTKVLIKNKISNKVLQKIKNHEEIAFYAKILTMHTRDSKNFPGKDITTLLYVGDSDDPKLRQAQHDEENIKFKEFKDRYSTDNNSARYSTDMKFVYNPPLNGATGGLFCWTGKLVKKSGEYFLVYARNAIGEIFNESIGDNPFINKSSTEGIFAFKLNKEDRTPLFQGKTIRVCGKFSDTSELMNGRVVPILTDVTAQQ